MRVLEPERGIHGPHGVIRHGKGCSEKRRQSTAGESLHRRTGLEHDGRESRHPLVAEGLLHVHRDDARVAQGSDDDGTVDPPRLERVHEHASEALDRRRGEIPAERRPRTPDRDIGDEKLHTLGGRGGGDREGFGIGADGFRHTLS
jgi:hypothetical protein